MVSLYVVYGGGGVYKGCTKKGVLEVEYGLGFGVLGFKAGCQFWNNGLGVCCLGFRSLGFRGLGI